MIGRISDLTYETASQFRAATNSSTPDRPDDDFLAHFGRVWVEDVAKPDPSSETKIVTGPFMTPSGITYVMTWGERDMTPEEDARINGPRRQATAIAWTNGLYERRARVLDRQGDRVGAILERLKKRN